MAETVPTARALEQLLSEKIPLAGAMGIRVAELAPTHLVIEAPLEPNRNHLGTAFGGSLHAVATLAGYSMAWTLLRETGFDGHVVLKRSEVLFRSPVEGRLRAICERPPENDYQQFVSQLRRHQRARLELSVSIAGSDRPDAVMFSGTFVAVP